MGRGEERLLCDPGSELLLGRRDKRRAKIVNGKSKKQKLRGVAQRTLEITVVFPPV